MSAPMSNLHRFGEIDRLEVLPRLGHPAPGCTEKPDAEHTTPRHENTGPRRTGAALMRLDHKHALALLPLVDPDRMRSGRVVGLRDGAVLALAAAGLTTIEIAALPASAILTE